MSLTEFFPRFLVNLWQKFSISIANKLDSFYLISLIKNENNSCRRIFWKPIQYPINDMKHKTAFLPVVDLLQNFCHFSIIVVLEFNIASRCSNKNTIQNQKQPNLFSSSHQARCGDRAPFSRVLGSQCFLVLFKFFDHKIIQHMDPMLKHLILCLVWIQYWYYLEWMKIKGR